MLYTRFKNPSRYTVFSREYKYVYCIILIGCSLLVSVLVNRPVPSTPDEIWDVVSREGKKHNINPSFIFAIAFAESSFNAHANSRYARGMMQISKTAWREVSDLSYRKAWDWRHNIKVGTNYLAHNRKLLQKHRHFSYPLLIATDFLQLKKVGLIFKK